MPAELSTGLLVAAPSMLDPNFARSVVLLTTHQEEGSLGFIINRPLAMSFSEVAEELEIGVDGAPLPDVPVLSGGPVAPETGWVLYDPKELGREPDETVMEVSDRLHISTSRELLETVAKESELSRHLLVLGYAGWGEGQLDIEIKQGAWIPVDLSEGILFDTAVEDRWEAAIALLGIDPKYLVGLPIAQA